MSKFFPFKSASPVVNTAPVVTQKAPAGYDAAADAAYVGTDKYYIDDLNRAVGLPSYAVLSPTVLLALATFIRNYLVNYGNGALVNPADGHYQSYQTEYNRVLAAMGQPPQIVVPKDGWATASDLGLNRTSPQEPRKVG